MKMVTLIIVRYLVILLVLLFLVSLVWVGIRTFLLLQKSKQLVRTSQAFQRVLPGGQPRLLVVGDSTAVGTGSVQPAESVAGRFGADYPKAEILNLGENGLRTADVVPRLKELSNADYDLVILQVGGNDILYFTALDTVAENIKNVAHEAKRVSRGPVVLLHSGNVGLAPFFPRPVAWLWSRRTRQVREIFKAAAQREGVVYIDLYKEANDDIFLTDPKKNYAADLLHPSGDGYGVWYAAIKAQMQINSIEFK